MIKTHDNAAPKGSAQSIPDNAAMAGNAGRSPDSADMAGNAGRVPDSADMTGNAGRAPDNLAVTGNAGRAPDNAAMAGSARKTIDIALPKGRLGDQAYAIFEAAGYECPDIHEDSRRLVFENAEAGVRYFWVKATDVSIYVERGAADIGITGKDSLLEGSPDVYELADLQIGKCRMCVAAERGFSYDPARPVRVATKYPGIAKDYYSGQGRDIDIITLNGSVELAPLLGLSDVIVDIVQTGKTLVENNLEVFENIVDISARLISNKVSYKFKHKEIAAMCNRINEHVDSEK